MWAAVESEIGNLERDEPDLTWNRALHIQSYLMTPSEHDFPCVGLNTRTRRWLSSVLASTAVEVDG